MLVGKYIHVAYLIQKSKEELMSKKQLTTDQMQDVIHQLDQYLSDLKIRWDQENPGNHSWWKISKTYLVSSTMFLINVADEIIVFVEGIIPAGEDKKAATLAIIGKLFDYIVLQVFPFWIKPFAPIIKDIIVNIIVGNLIDYIVTKYNAGFWKMEQPNG